MYKLALNGKKGSLGWKMIKLFVLPGVHIRKRMLKQKEILFPCRIQEKFVSANNLRVYSSVVCGED